MLSSPLPLVEVNPSSKPVAVVIWLHGLGADGHDFEPVVPALQLPEALPVRFIFPHAPEMAITAFGGERARAWFDFETSGSSAMPGIDRSAHAIKDLIQQEIDNGILHEDRIIYYELAVDHPFCALQMGDKQRLSLIIHRIQGMDPKLRQIIQQSHLVGKFPRPRSSPLRSRHFSIRSEILMQVLIQLRVTSMYAPKHI